ncbi:hypothetical protein B0J14DRAFT_593049 [Halenospora varia]|nr:hypothetical protein B0J14DRAFT_593049 [Halenospora varia]
MAGKAHPSKPDDPKGESDPSKPDPKIHPKSIPTKEKMLQELQKHLDSAQNLQKEAIDLRQKAEHAANDDEKGGVLEEAAKKEKESLNEMKIVKRLQSGAWQGGAAGAGMGAGIGAGLGTVVGSIVGGVTAIPTTGLGLLAGVTIGAIHGPWVKLVGDKDGKKEEVEVNVETGEERKVEESGGGDGSDHEGNGDNRGRIWARVMICMICILAVLVAWHCVGGKNKLDKKHIEL